MKTKFFGVAALRGVHSVIQFFITSALALGITTSLYSPAHSDTLYSWHFDASGMFFYKANGPNGEIGSTSWFETAEGAGTLTTNSIGDIISATGTVNGSQTTQQCFPSACPVNFQTSTFTHGITNGSGNILESFTLTPSPLNLFVVLTIGADGSAYYGNLFNITWPLHGTAELSQVPLPAALPLFATGLGVLGLLGWRRKRKPVELAA